MPAAPTSYTPGKLPGWVTQDEAWGKQLTGGLGGGTAVPGKIPTGGARPARPGLGGADDDGGDGPGGRKENWFMRMRQREHLGGLWRIKRQRDGRRIERQRDGRWCRRGDGRRCRRDASLVGSRHGAPSGCRRAVGHRRRRRRGRHRWRNGHGSGGWRRARHAAAPAVDGRPQGCLWRRRRRCWWRWRRCQWRRSWRWRYPTRRDAARAHD